MSRRRLYSTIFGIAVLLMLETCANAQISEQAARERALNTARSQLHLDPGKFLQVQRDEGLEQSLAAVVSRLAWSEFIYRVSQAGDEIKENVIVHHIFMDVDATYIIAISPADTSTYRIQGFTDSLTEFEKLMAAAKVKVSSPEQAEAVAHFYREVNPQRTSLTPITSLIELKQAAERQCQTSSFDSGEKAFNAWWKYAKPLYAGIPFRETATRHGSGYFVKWIVLSSAGPGNCGGAPLQTQLEVKGDGQLGKLTFLPPPKKDH